MFCVAGINPFTTGAEITYIALVGMGGDVYHESMEWVDLSPEIISSGLGVVASKCVKMTCL